jgi:glutamine amidotransferase
MKKIGVIDYKIGNIGSVIKALKYLNADVDIIDSPKKIKTNDKIILPGVSSFGAAVDNLHKYNFYNEIIEHIEKKKWYLGICVGFQLLFDKSEETPGKQGLNIFKGTIKKFRNPNIPIPHMGWNQVEFKQNLFFNKNIENNDFFYFVHSYFPVPENKNIILSETNYENEIFCSSIFKDNVIATQFHPEKSQDNGLKLLKNFIEI